MEIVWSIVIMLVLGAGFGLLLAYLGKKLEVESDPRVDEVAKHLAGINCGTCGYPGCDAFAEALVKGETKLEACRPTKKPAKEEINKILNVVTE